MRTGASAGAISASGEGGGAMVLTSAGADVSVEPADLDNTAAVAWGTVFTDCSGWLAGAATGVDVAVGDAADSFPEAVPVGAGVAVLEHAASISSKISEVPTTLRVRIFINRVMSILLVPSLGLYC